MLRTEIKPLPTKAASLCFHSIRTVSVLSDELSLLVQPGSDTEHNNINTAPTCSRSGADVMLSDVEIIIILNRYRIYIIKCLNVDMMDFKNV